MFGYVSDEQKLVDRILLMRNFENLVNSSEYITFDRQTIIDLMKQALTATPVVNHIIEGSWLPINQDDLGYTSTYKCSTCGDIYRANYAMNQCFTKFCSCCGSKNSR